MNDSLDMRFLAARKNYIEGRFSMLNNMQRQAVLTTEGPLLLLAGAGSGKTTVLINRIANLLRYGHGSEGKEIPDFVTEADVRFLEGLSADPSENERVRADELCALEPVKPWNIIAITFTNKAAGELKDRLAAKLGPEANDIWAATFHSAIQGEGSKQQSMPDLLRMAQLILLLLQLLQLAFLQFRVAQQLIPILNIIRVLTAFAS